MKVAARRVTSCALSLLLAALFLSAGPARADPAITAAQAQQRAKAVTQVVLGILSLLTLAWVNPVLAPKTALLRRRPLARRTLALAPVPGRPDRIRR